jgi:hypothetical protein
MRYNFKLTELVRSRLVLGWWSFRISARTLAILTEKSMIGINVDINVESATLEWTFVLTLEGLDQGEIVMLYSVHMK